MGRLVNIADIGSTNESSAAGGSRNIITSTFRTAPTSFPTSTGAESGHGGGFNNMVNNNNGLARESIMSSRNTDDSENRSIPTTFSTLSSLTSTSTASRTTSSGRRSGHVSIADLGGATNKRGGSMMTGPMGGGGGGSATKTTTLFQNNATDSSVPESNEGRDHGSMSDNEVSVSSLQALAEAEENPSPLFGVGSSNLEAGAAASLAGARTIQEPDQGIMNPLAPPRRSAAGALAYGYHQKGHSPFPPSYPRAAAAPLVDSAKKGTVVRLTDLRKRAASHAAPVEAATCESNATATPTPTTIELVESVNIIAPLDNHTATEMKHPLELSPGIAPNELVAVLEYNDTPPPPPPPHHASHTIMNENDSKNYYYSDYGNDRSVLEATIVGELFESSAPLQQQQQEQLPRSSSSLSSGLNSDTLVEKADEEWGIPMSVVFTPSHSMSHAPNPIVKSIGNRLGSWRSGASRGSPRMGMKKRLNPNATSTTSIPTTTTSASNGDSEQLLLRQSREKEPDSGHDGGPGTTRTTTTTSMGVGHMEQLPTSDVYHVGVSGTSGETLISSSKSGEAIVDSKPVRWVNAKSVFFAVVCTIVVLGSPSFLACPPTKGNTKAIHPNFPPASSHSMFSTPAYTTFPPLSGGLCKMVRSAGTLIHAVAKDVLRS